ncbi:hypothetical protein Tco_1408278 [Tanacetum coccineum]
MKVWVSLSGLPQRTLANGIQELVASIDNKEYTITEASIKSKLQLADATGISNLPDAKIYDGLATLGTVANGIQELVASIDNKEYTITEASVISKLQLGDATGISNLPDVEIYVGLATLGHKSGGWDQFGSPIVNALICLSREHVPLLPAILAGAAEDQGEGSANQAEPNPTPIDLVPSISQPPIPSTTEPP